MPTLEERLAALEARSEAQAMNTTDLRGALTELRGDMNQRFAQVDRWFEQMDRRFTDLQDQMHRRFDTADQKTDRHFTWLVGILVAGLVTMIGTVAGAFFGLWQMLR